MEALDTNDRLLAVAVWAGLLFGGPILPVLVLGMNWSKPDSLARHHALIATVMWAVVLVFYVPLVVRMGATGGPDALFFAGLAIAAAAVLVVSCANAVRALRAPVRESVVAS